MEAFSMRRSKALAPDGVEVRLGAVTGMFVKTVTRIKFFELIHIAVTEDFRKDRGCRDACDATIAFNDGHLLFGRNTTDFEIAIDGN